MLQLNNQTLEAFLADLANEPIIMGILNTTPDSFSDGGQYNQADDALTHAYSMQEAGAKIIDVGAESTRPTATPIDADTEIARLTPVLERLCNQISAAVSVDTYKSAVAKWAIRQGACVINDVWGLQRDKKMAGVIAESGAGVIIMHNRDSTDGNIDMVCEVCQFLELSLKLAHNAGIEDNKIILDPGLGFGKTVSQNYDIMRHLDKIKAFGYPVLVGLSRKRMIGELLELEMHDRLAGTLAANVLALVQGADILRVHDVREHVHALGVFKAMKQGII